MELLLNGDQMWINQCLEWSVFVCDEHFIKHPFYYPLALSTTCRYSKFTLSLESKSEERRGKFNHVTTTCSKGTFNKEFRYVSSHLYHRITFFLFDLMLLPGKAISINRLNLLTKLSPTLSGSHYCTLSLLSCSNKKMEFFCTSVFTSELVNSRITLNRGSKI